MTESNSLPFTHPIICYFWLQPGGKYASRLDEQKFAIAVHNLHPDVFVSLGEFPENIDHHPLVLDGVSVVGAPAQ